MARDDSLDSVKAFLERVGFQECATSAVEIGFEKVAIYADRHGPQHVARQLPNGRWTSKLGAAIDAEHDTLNVLEGGTSGNVVMFMKRKAGSPPQLPELQPPKPRLVTTAGDVLIR
jgi:hypothetical protein